MLWAETAKSLVPSTIGKFNESVFSQIRSFVIVAVNRERHFIYAWLDHDERFKAYKLT
jgi:hypothetical protein